GVPNAVTASGPQRDVVPDFGRFRRAAELLQAAQELSLATVQVDDRLVEVGGPVPTSAVTAAAAGEAGQNGLEHRPREGGDTSSLVRKERRLVVEVRPAALGHPVLSELNQLLNLEPARPRYEITVAPGPVPDPLLAPGLPSADLRVNLRSTSQVLFY